ncbi:branched-chain amino acid ABC transporter substrate-binding protein [Bacillus sp. 03113]|uniref:branched-chain amino acid ABC transporter substrate-binding protein n=1 Tax=Bacillus sp. 03113 TaxID=2578211 RepID=UPI001141F5DD|nr:branched-chain amino acid ABC transporter substrate-binding protein [Bacillus sp. 03113]
MKVMKDERLIIRGLKNIRIAFAIQTLGIIGILIFDGITKGFSNVTDNPLWLLFIGTSVILGYLNLSISVDTYESSSKREKVPFYLVMLISFAIVAIITLCIILFSGSTIKDAIIIGLVIFICFLIPTSITYYMRKKRSQDED